MACERPHPTHYPRNALKALGWAAAVLAGALFSGARRLQRLEVAGDSMRPAFEPGDRLLAVRLGRIRAGDVVAVPAPRDATRLIVKRVASVSGPTLVLRGDNEAASTDSRSFGPVPSSSVAGRVFYRYSPPERVTWWP